MVDAHAEVVFAQPLEAVGEVRQADGDVGVRVFRRGRRRILSDERDREEAARPRQVALRRGIGDLVHLEQSIVHAVGLHEHVRQQRAEPRGAQVEHLDEVVGEGEH